MPAASENALSGAVPEATASGYQDTAQHVHLSIANQVSWVGNSSRSGHLVTQVPILLGSMAREVRSLPGVPLPGLPPYTQLPKGTSGLLTAHPHPVPCLCTVTPTQPTPQPGEAWVPPGPQL